MNEDNIVKFKKKDLVVSTDLSGYAINTDISKPSFSFVNESGNIIGKLFINDDDVLSFEGNAESSAIQFFKFFAQTYEEYIRQMIEANINAKILADENSIQEEMISKDIFKLKVVDKSTHIDISQLSVYEAPLGQYENGFSFKDKAKNKICISELLADHIKYCYKADTSKFYSIPVDHIEDGNSVTIVTIHPAHRYHPDDEKRVMLELHIMTSEVATIDDAKLLFDITNYFK